MAIFFLYSMYTFKKLNNIFTNLVVSFAKYAVDTLSEVILLTKQLYLLLE